MYLVHCATSCAAVPLNVQRPQTTAEGLMHSRNALQLGLRGIYYTLEQRYITHVQGCGIYSDLHTAGKEWKLCMEHIPSVLLILQSYIANYKSTNMLHTY